MNRRVRILMMTLAVALAARANAADPPQSAPKAAQNGQDRAALEKAFAEKMTGATLVGRFTVAGKDNVEPKPERYELGAVTKLEGDKWLFTARINYGDTDVNLPIPLTVVWAGDTPIITLTNETIPGLGTFTVRVMFHGDRYAGTWQHDQLGGHLFGTIQPAEKKEAPRQ